MRCWCCQASCWRRAPGAGAAIPARPPARRGISRRFLESRSSLATNKALRNTIAGAGSGRSSASASMMASAALGGVLLASRPQLALARASHAGGRVALQRVGRSSLKVRQFRAVHAGTAARRHRPRPPHRPGHELGAAAQARLPAPCAFARGHVRRHHGLRSRRAGWRWPQRRAWNGPHTSARPRHRLPAAQSWRAGPAACSSASGAVRSSAANQLWKVRICTGRSAGEHLAVQIL
jgi:hypothetical protein